jgi:glycosyltransferase involved in cell wall biosynthesis
VAPRRGEWDDAADEAFVRKWLAAPAARPPGVAGPATSVVMPVRNRPGQVLDAIASVQAQSLEDWELIVVDDGSTDQTASIVEREAQQDPRIRLLRRRALGVGAARNAGVAAARGHRIAFLDSDNTWVPHFLQVMVSYLQSSDLRAGYSVVNAVSAADDAAEFSHLFFDGGLDHLLVENHIDLNSLVVDATLVRALGGFDTQLRRWVDHDFAIRLARKTSAQLVPFVGVRYDHASDAPDRITNTESEHWRWVALGKNYVDWVALEENATDRVPGRTSICMPTYQDWTLTAAAVTRVLAAADAEGSAGGRGHDVEVVVVDNGSRRQVSALLRARFISEPRVRIRSVARNLNFAVGSNIAFAESTGETVVFLNNDTEVLPGWLAPLLDVLDDEEVLGCQPVLLYPNGTIQSAGTVFLGGDHLPSPLLVGHPLDDARRAAPIRLRAVSASALAMRATDVIEFRGFDPIFVNGLEGVDLCLRAVNGGSRRFAVVPDSIVLHHESRTPGRGARLQANRKIWMERWQGRLPERDLGIVEGLGFKVAHVAPGDRVSQPGDIRVPRPVLVRPPAQVEGGVMSGHPRLRWALKTSVPVREVGGELFDLECANDLARALRLLGQDVVVDPWECNQRATAHFDDVVVAVRGDVPLVEEPGRVNILWPISVPVAVSQAEARRYDTVVLTTDAGPMTYPGATWDPVEAEVQVSEGGLDAAARLLLSMTVETLARTGTRPHPAHLPSVDVLPESPAAVGAVGARALRLGGNWSTTPREVS